uniref:Uncharacterized protein n=1 Tax=Noccaea caerulescens TaxID=107243 RepID=A0A1J3E7B2_NOCCA
MSCLLEEHLYYSTALSNRDQTGKITEKISHFFMIQETELFTAKGFISSSAKGLGSCRAIFLLDQERVFFWENGGRWILKEIENGKKMVSTNGYFVVRERKLIQWHCARERNPRHFQGCSLRFTFSKNSTPTNQGTFQFVFWFGSVR